MNSPSAHSLLRSIKPRAVIRLGCILALLECFALHALTLTWRAPESGPALAGYYLYMREASSETFSKIDVGNVTSHVVNDLVPGRTYVFYVTAFNPYGLESDPSNTYTYEPREEPREEPEAFVTTLLAREALLLDSDVILHEDPLTYTGLPTTPIAEYLVALRDEKGWAHFHPMLPAAGNYAIWCRVLAPDPDSDSFYVAINGKSQGVFEAGFAGPVWQWTRLTTRNPVNPQQIQSTFSFRQSVNEISFGGREANIHLAQLLITNDPHFVPAEVAAGRIPLQIRNTNYGRILKWPSIPGSTYHVFHSPEFGKVPWTAVGEPLVAAGPETEWLAPAAQFSSGFFWVGVGR